jgi:hypothetical protein
VSKRAAVEDEQEFDPKPYQAPPEDPAERAAAAQLWQDYQACIARVLRERAGRGGEG